MKIYKSKFANFPIEKQDKIKNSLFSACKDYLSIGDSVDLARTKAYLGSGLARGLSVSLIKENSELQNMFKAREAYVRSKLTRWS